MRVESWDGGEESRSSLRIAFLEHGIAGVSALADQGRNALAAPLLSSPSSLSSTPTIRCLFFPIPGQNQRTVVIAKPNTHRCRGVKSAVTDVHTRIKRMAGNTKCHYHAELPMMPGTWPTTYISRVGTQNYLPAPFWTNCLVYPYRELFRSLPSCSSHEHCQPP